MGSLCWLSNLFSQVVFSIKKPKLGWLSSFYTAYYRN